MTLKLQTEDQVVASCKRLLKKQGWVTKTVYLGGIPAGFGRYATNPLKGFPDCIALHPELGTMVLLEFKKTKGGILSPEQKEFHALLKQCGITVWVINSKELLTTLLKERGLWTQVIKSSNLSGIRRGVA